MPEMILDTDYWKKRLDDAIRKNELHQAVFRCPLERWQRIEAKHREILASVIEDRDSILDCGCGWGRLLTLLPPTWNGRYLGVDISPDFIALAQELHPTREFVVGDLRNLTMPDRFTFAVLVSVRPMVKRNLGETVWQQMNFEIKRRTSKTLYLEYDEKDEGEVECV